MQGSLEMDVVADRQTMCTAVCSTEFRKQDSDGYEYIAGLWLCVVASFFAECSEAVEVYNISTCS